MLDACAAYADEHGFARIVLSPSERSDPALRASRVRAGDLADAASRAGRLTGHGTSWSSTTPGRATTAPTAKSGTVSPVSSSSGQVQPSVAW